MPATLISISIEMPVVPSAPPFFIPLKCVLHLLLVTASKCLDLLELLHRHWEVSESTPSTSHTSLPLPPRSHSFDKVCPPNIVHISYLFCSCEHLEQNFRRDELWCAKIFTQIFQIKAINGIIILMGNLVIIGLIKFLKLFRHLEELRVMWPTDHSCQ